MTLTRRLFVMVVLTGTAAPTVAQRPLVLRGATIIDGTDSAPIPGGVIVIRGDRIVAVGPAGAVPVPAGARVVDLTGRYVVPGFMDLHAHTVLGAWTVDSSGGKRELRMEYDDAASVELIRTQLAFGVTTVRNPSAQTRAAIALRDRLRLGEIQGARLVTAGAILETTPAGDMVVKVTTETEVRAEVARQAAAGVDVIKLYARLTPDLIRAGVDEAHRWGIQATGHLWQTSWTDAANAGIDAIEHITPGNAALLPPEKRERYLAVKGTQFMFRWFEEVDLDGPEIGEMIAALVRHHVTVDPTLLAFEAIAWADDSTRFPTNINWLLPPSLLKGSGGGQLLSLGWTPDDYQMAKRVWPRILAFAKKLHEEGVRLVVGTDAPVGWFYHRELELLVDAGIPAADVLRLATRNAAQALGKITELGTVTRGKIADLVVLSADPLEDIRNTRRIERVIQSGVVHRPADLLPKRPKTD
jgi:imidazolonepropionase-like amidohydrolase